MTDPAPMLVPAGPSIVTSKPIGLAPAMTAKTLAAAHEIARGRSRYPVAA